MNRDEITRKTSELSTPDTPAISLLKTVIQRKKKCTSPELFCRSDSQNGNH